MRRLFYIFNAKHSIHGKIFLRLKHYNEVKFTILSDHYHFTQQTNDYLKVWKNPSMKYCGINLEQALIC